MKFNFLKYIFIIIVIILLGFAFYKFQFAQDESVQIQTVQEDIVKEITIGIAGYDSFNPYITNNKNMQEIINIVYPGLLEIQSDFKPNYVLVDSIEKISDLEYLVTLRDNILFSDGTAVSCEDIVFSFDKAKNTQNLFADVVSNISSIETKDSRSLLVTLNDASYTFEYYLTFPIVKSKTFDTDPVPIGVGQFYVDTLDDTNFYLKVNQNYINHDEEIVLEKVNIVRCANLNELYNKFKLGGIDVISTSNTNIKEYIGKVGYNEKQVLDNNHIFLAFNTQTELFSNEEIRKAITYAIDTDNAIATTFGTEVGATTFPISYGSWLYDDIITSSRYNQDMAQELLQNNGYTLSKGIFQKTENKKTTNLTFKILVNSSNTQMITLANTIVSNLNNFGIMATITQLPYEQYITSLDARDYDMVLCETQLSYIPDLSLFFGQSNLANYQNDQIDEIIEQLMELDNSNKKQLYTELADIYKSTCAYISIGNRRKTIVYNQNLAGNLEPTWFNPYNHIYSWYK